MNANNLQPVEKVSEKSHQIVIREVARNRFGLRLGLGLLGLGCVAAAIGSGYLVDTDLNPIVVILICVSVIGFGLIALISWRQSGESEMVEIANGRLRLLNSRTNGGLAFDAPVSIAKVQRVRHSLGTRVCLRDGTSTVEFANSLSPAQREMLAGKIEEALENAKHSSSDA